MMMAIICDFIILILIFFLPAGEPASKGAVCERCAEGLEALADLNRDNINKDSEEVDKDDHVDKDDDDDDENTEMLCFILITRKWILPPPPFGSESRSFFFVMDTMWGLPDAS